MSVQPVKLFIGVLASKGFDLESTYRQLNKCFGPEEDLSPIWQFKETDYYCREMGPDIVRQFLSFRLLVFPDELAGIKNYTRSIERAKSVDGKRRVNFDPGYLNMSKVVLATTKDYSHRIYIGEGIFAEVTLYYSKDRWQYWPWTYPDYKKKEYLDYFSRLREIYRKQLEEIKNDNINNNPPPRRL